MTDNPGDLSGLFYVIVKRRKFLFWNTLVVTLLALGVAFLLPMRYKATATLLPPENQGKDILGLGAVLQSMDVSKLPLTGVSSNDQVYLAILKSRTVADSLIDEFHLMKRYKVKNRETARRALRSASEFRLTTTGLIEVSVEDRDPQVAANMANSFVIHLDQINRTLRMSEGRRTRIFVEGRLKATEERLQAAENTLLTYKEDNPGVVLPEDVSAAVNASASLMAQRIMAGAELEELRSTFLPRSPLLVQKELAVTSLDKQLENLPRIQLELGRRLRDFRIQEKVYELLISQFEEARIRENRDVTTIDVLDTAVPPLQKSFPHRGLLTMGAFALSIIVGILLVVSFEALSRMRIQQDTRIVSIVRPGSSLDRLLFGQSRKSV